MTDGQNLLAEYVRAGSETAFRELVTRYVNLVYSTALRLAGGDSHRAEDVSQTVFLNLARAARTLPKDVKLGGWLHRDTCFVASTLMRGERRRQSREKQAAEMNALQINSGADFSLIAPLLDEAINELGDADRTAILLRFFEQHDFRSVGEALGSNEDAARMRVTRALEKLEECLKRRGVTSTAASLGVVLSVNAVQAAPVGLAITISTAAALAGATLATTATAANAIALTATQKLLAATIVAASVIVPVLVQHRAQSQLAGQDRVLQRQAAQFAELQMENDHLVNVRAETISSRSLSDSQFDELLRLRSQVTRLNAEVRELTKLTVTSSTTRSNAPMTKSNQLTAMQQVWAERTIQLKQWLEANPAGRTPELEFLTDQEWIDAIYPFTLSSDEEYRRAMSSARLNAENRILDILGGALRRYGRDNNGQFPSALSQLAPYFRTPVSDAILDRYEIVRADSLVSELREGEDWVITQKAPVDEMWDGRLTMGMTSGGMADSRVTNRWAKTSLT